MDFHTPGLYSYLSTIATMFVLFLMIPFHFSLAS